MRIRQFILTLTAALMLQLPLAAQRDTTALMRTMDQYLQAIDYLPHEEACAEADFLISSVRDSSLRSTIAVKAYKHFRASKVMDSENVAVHIYDNWFATFKTVFDSLDELDEAEFYAFVNRASLLGAKASTLTFKDLRSRDVTLPSSAVTKTARPSIIFFYSVGCPNCLVTSIELKEYFKKQRPEADLYTIYTGDDAKEWKNYTRFELNIPNRCKSNVYHLTGGDTDYVLPYGVTQTPRLFLVDSNGIIIGRCLDVPALKILLQ